MSFLKIEKKKHKFNFQKIELPYYIHGFFYKYNGIFP